MLGSHFLILTTFSVFLTSFSLNNCRMYRRFLPRYTKSIFNKRVLLCTSTQLINDSSKKRIVFLGTPDISATALKILYDESKSLSSTFVLSAVVSQPPAPSGRNKRLTPSPVHELADTLKIPLYVPDKAKDLEFLKNLEDLKPDLCITAAYGNYLPKSFLSIPKYGTINLHPSFLPKYRGASPVQRSLENGDKIIGISILFTVLKMDAGPIIKQIPYSLHGNEKSSEVLNQTFCIGTKEIINLLPSIWSNSVITTLQNEEEATVAPKLNVSEAKVDFSISSALTIHNKCRGFSIWPGTWSTFKIDDEEIQKIKIITTIVLNPPGTVPPEDRTRHVTQIKCKEINGDVLQVICSDGSVLGLFEVQPLSRKVMKARDFANGLRGRKLTWEPCPDESEATSGTSASDAADR